MELSANTFKRKLVAGDLQIGLWSNLACTTSAEVIAASGYDWVMLDMEHGPNELVSVIAQAQVLAASQSAALVRPPWNDFVLIKRLLDAGMRSLLVPFVQNAEEAAAAVRAVRYPPDGIRGVGGTTRATSYGRVREYTARANAEICLLVQVETADALEKLEEIASVDGIDGVFVGPADLAASLGYLGNFNAEPVQAAIKSTAERLNKVGVTAGIISADPVQAQQYIDWGYRFVGVGTDSGLLAKSADSVLARFR
ncbi:MAG: HpcH/HpaI aldolase/citrate lyase family protein [Pseudomonadota bacterium]